MQQYLQVGVGTGNIFIAVLVNFSITYLPKQHTRHFIESNLCHIFCVNIYIIYTVMYIYTPTFTLGKNCLLDLFWQTGTKMMNFKHLLFFQPDDWYFGITIE